MARTVWSATTLTADSDLTPIEPAVASWGVTSLANKHTLAKNEIARTLRARYSDLKEAAYSKETGTDGVTNGTSTFSSASATFSTNKVSVGDRVWLETGTDKGVFTVLTVASNTALTLSPTPGASETGITYSVEPEVLDLIKNPLILTPAAAFLVLHYAALELVQAAGDFWDLRAGMYRHRYEETYKQTISDLLIDADQDGIISQSERKPGISGGSLIR